jgi:hypothetical protein
VPLPIEPIAWRPTLETIVQNLDYLAQRDKPASLVLNYQDYEQNFTAKEKETVLKHFWAGHIKILFVNTSEIPKDFQGKIGVVELIAQPYLDEMAAQNRKGFLGNEKVLYLSSQKVASSQPIAAKLGKEKERFVFLKELAELENGEILTLGILHVSAKYFTNPEYYEGALVPSPSGFWVPTSLQHYLVQLTTEYLSAQSIGQAA